MLKVFRQLLFTIFCTQKYRDWEPKRNNPHLQQKVFLGICSLNTKFTNFCTKAFYHSTNESRHKAMTIKMIELLNSHWLWWFTQNSLMLKTQIETNKVYHHLFHNTEHLGYYQAFRGHRYFLWVGIGGFSETFMDSKLQSRDT